jgi:bromodomain-containing factor 1
LEPVDPVALGIPQYFDIVKRPMDLGTVEKKLDGGAYLGTEDFVADVKLVFKNCYKFNGRESFISQMAKTLESSFNKQMRKMQAPSQQVRGGA